jgi:hypothetical protein
LVWFWVTVIGLSLWPIAHNQICCWFIAHHQICCFSPLRITKFTAVAHSAEIPKKLISQRIKTYIQNCFRSRIRGPVGYFWYFREKISCFFPFKVILVTIVHC